MMPQPTHLRPLLAAARTGEALQQLAAWAETQSPIWRKSALLLQASWAHNERQAKTGLINNEEANRIRTRVTQAALGLIDEIETGASAPKTVLKGLEKEFLNDQVAGILNNGNFADLSGSHINVQGSQDVVIGSGNTITKKTIAGLGRRQFWSLTAGLAVVLFGGYFGFQALFGGQRAAFVSLRDIQKELAILADLNGDVRAKLESNGAELESWLTKGQDALKSGDFPTAVQYLEKVAGEAPLATVRQNLAYAYEQMGNADKARENLEAAKKINPNLDTGKSYAQLKGKRINLLAPENGGAIKVSDEPGMVQLADGSTKSFHNKGGVWGVWGFKDDRKAAFDEVQYFVPSSGRYHIQQFVLSYGDNPTGTFTPIDTFELFDGLIHDQPFQSFKFPKVNAKYVRFEAPGGCGAIGCDLFELQLMGEL